VGTLL